MTFPTVEAENLDGEALVFPRDFRRRTIALVAFDFKARAEIESWVPFVERYARDGRIDGRVFAAIPRSMRMMKGVILGTMRKGVPSVEARSVTVPIFVDLDPFCAALNIRDRATIAVLVVDPGGEVRTQQSGAYGDAAAAAIEALVRVPA